MSIDIQFSGFQSERALLKGLGWCLFGDKACQFISVGWMEPVDVQWLSAECPLQLQLIEWSVEGHLQGSPTAPR